jgi:hypothetical protein
MIFTPSPNPQIIMLLYAAALAQQAGALNAAKVSSGVLRTGTADTGG